MIVHAKYMYMYICQRHCQDSDWQNWFDQQYKLAWPVSLCHWFSPSVWTQWQRAREPELQTASGRPGQRPEQRNHHQWRDSEPIASGPGYKHTQSLSLSLSPSPPPLSLIPCTHTHTHTHTHKTKNLTLARYRHGSGFSLFLLIP